MKRWLVDTYLINEKIILWIKSNSKNERIEIDYTPTLYVQIDAHSKKYFADTKLPKIAVRKKTYLGKKKRVYAIQTTKFHQIIRDIEHATNYNAVLYDADVSPEYQYLYKHGLAPLCAIGEEITEDKAPLVTCRICCSDDLTRIEVNAMQFIGENYLQQFADYFHQLDPDVIYMFRAFSQLAKLVKLLEKNTVEVQFHRWDKTPIIAKGGKSFFSYGKVKYQEFAIRLHGRLLVDINTPIGDECETNAIIELCELSGAGFQQVASRSYGAVFQFAIIRELYSKQLLVPYKEKPIDKPLSLWGLLKSDRAGQTLDPKIGFHTDVAEIDFASMFPWIIYNYNISADTILCDKGPFEKVPGTPIRVSRHHLGITPKVIKPFIDRRMYYKKHPSVINKERSLGLKAVLVSSYGYLRFREFKLGIPSAHMAICAYARKILFTAIDIAKKHGFEIVHGVIDSLYIKKKNITKQDVDLVCEEIEQLIGIPISNEGIFSWICFCPSVNDPQIPVPTKHFGIFRNGEIKARGIEVRERAKPKIVRDFQKELLLELYDLTNVAQFKEKLHALKKIYAKYMEKVEGATADELKIRLCLGDGEYTSDIPQKIIVEKYKKKGVDLKPGQVVYFIHTTKGVVLVSEYVGKPHIQKYTDYFFRAMLQISQPFGVRSTQLKEFLEIERQTTVNEFTQFKHVYIPMAKKYANYAGLSEKIVRKELEKKGWVVWRGGLIHYAGKAHEYPNVQKKYQLLLELLEKYHPNVQKQLEYICLVHHGMPDFICYRNGKFLFVECKLGYESVKAGQRICAQKLSAFGFDVEIHRLVDTPTKVRVAYVNWNTNKTYMHQRQMTLLS